MKTSESIKNISVVLLSIQNEFIVISKSTQGQRNKYASYDQLIAKAKPILTNAGILILQPVDNYEGQQAIRTRLVHAESGEYFESCSIIKMMDVKNKQGESTINEAQQAGGGISYAKRYALASMLAWATGDYDFDQGSLDNIQDAKNSVIVGVGAIMTIPKLTEYFKKNNSQKIAKELIEACAVRKAEIVKKESENGDN